MRNLLIVGALFLAGTGWIRLPMELQGENDCPTDICLGYAYGEDAIMWLFVDDTQIVAMSMITTWDISEADWNETVDVEFDNLWAFAGLTQVEWDCLMDGTWNDKTCGKLIYSSRSADNTFTQIWNWEYRGLPVTTDL